MDRPPWWLTLRHRVGRRGSALLFFGTLDVVYAVSLLFPTEEARRSSALVFFDSIAGLSAWAVLWATVGVVCLWHAFVRVDTWGYRAAILIKMVWGGVSALGWILGGVPRGYVQLAVWYGLAGLVWIISGWPEPAGDGEDGA